MKTMFILLSAMDVFLTHCLISTGDFYEANPVAEPFQAQFGTMGLAVFKTVMVVLVMMGCGIIRSTSKRYYVKLIYAISNITTGGVVGYSSYMLLSYL